MVSMYLAVHTKALKAITKDIKAKKNSIRDARIPQPREIFSTPRDIEVLYEYKVQDTF